jgi:hypothetical protein
MEVHPGSLLVKPLGFFPLAGLSQELQIADRECFRMMAELQLKFVIDLDYETCLYYSQLELS